MVSFIRGWLNPTFQRGHQPQSSSIINDMVVTVALSVLALMTANVFDREAPGLAALLRCVPIGVSLIWLFKRCGLDSDGYGYYGMGGMNLPTTFVNPRSYPNGNMGCPPPLLHAAPQNRSYFPGTAFPGTAQGYHEQFQPFPTHVQQPLHTAPVFRGYTPTENQMGSALGHQAVMFPAAKKRDK
jgi:hypothetical protein